MPAAVNAEGVADYGCLIATMAKSRTAPNATSLFVLFNGLDLVAKRLEPNSDPPTVRIISDNPVYASYA